MTRRASRGRARVLVLVSCAGLLLALGVYVAVDGARESKPVTGESTFAARASRALFAPRRDQKTLTVGSAEVAGRVLTSAGAPIAGARVCCACASCPMTSTEAARCTISDAQGAFALRVTSKSAFVLSAQAAGFVTGYARGGAPFYVDAETRVQFELRLSEGQENLAGSVIDALGGPVARARIKIVRFVDALTPTVEVLADDEGRFSASVPPGPVTLRAEAEGYAPSTSGHVAPSRNILLALTPESVVHGTVSEAGTGKRLAGVSILAHPPTAAPKHPQTISDESGEFEVRGLEPGRYIFVAEGDHHRGETPRQVEVGLTERVVNVQIEAQPAALVMGSVEIAGSGAPCPQGRAVLGPASPLSIPVSAAAEQSAQDDVPSVAAAIEHDGTVRFRGVPAGRYHVMVQCLHHIYESGPARVRANSFTPSSRLHNKLFRVIARLMFELV